MALCGVYFMLFPDVDVSKVFIPIFHFKNFLHVLGLNVCDSDLVWYVELRRLRKFRLKEALKLCL